MTTATMSAPAANSPQSAGATQQIGETAGAVWRTLAQHGPQSLAKIVERVGGNRDQIMQGIGWLAREGKLEIVETRRGRIVSLRE